MYSRLKCKNGAKSSGYNILQYSKKKERKEEELERKKIRRINDRKERKTNVKKKRGKASKLTYLFSRQNCILSI